MSLKDWKITFKNALVDIKQELPTEEQFQFFKFAKDLILEEDSILFSKTLKALEDKDMTIFANKNVL